MRRDSGYKVEAKFHCFKSDGHPMCGQRGKYVLGCSTQPANAREFDRMATKRHAETCAKCMRMVEQEAP